MKRYYLLLSAGIFLAFISSCGKAPEKKHKKQTKLTPITEVPQINSEEKTEVVDADEFSKAFSKPVYQSKEQKTDIENDNGSRFFKSGKLVQNRFTNQEFKKNILPESSLASAIKTTFKYSWLPHWSFSGKGGVRLPDAAISADKSLIAILEKVSSQKDKISTLLILIDTYNFNIRAIYYFQGRLLSKIKFVSSQPNLIALEQNQEEDKSGMLHLIDLKSGKISASSKPLSSDSANFAITGDGKEIVLKTANRKKKIYIFTIENLEEMPTVVKCDQDEGKIVLSQNNKYFCLIGKKLIEIFKFSDNMKLKDIPLNLKTVPDDVICIDNDKFAMLSYQAPLIFVTPDGNKKELCPLAGRKLFFRNDVSKIVFEEYKNRAISILDLKSLEKSDSFSPEKLKPKTQGAALLISYLPHLKKYMVLDSQGNLSIFYRPGKRWRKRVIFSAEK